MGQQRGTSQEQRPSLPVSVVLTVLNEGGSIDEAMAALADQTVRPAEIVIVDGGSTDDTRLRLAAWQSRLPLRVLELPGANISQGRNHGIATAANGVVAVTDAGARPAPGWLAAICARLLPNAEPAADVVAGWFVSDPRTTFELAMGATVLPTLDEIDPDHFLASSRSIAFRRTAWNAAGGYPEWLDYCEDLIFDLCLLATGQAVHFVPAALVRFRPRGSWRSFWRQYYRYARGDGKAGLWPRRHAIRYGVYLAGLLVVGFGLVGGPWALAAAALLLGVGGLAYCWRPYARLLPHLAALRPTAALRAIAFVPLIRLVGDLAKMAGYPGGLVWRWRHRPPAWR